ncbi:unnamed protein product [Rodentolepis nana]|uniref:HTH La-type RNA-binding domain-containing protein n=1 Tax=Rodentolepis nana TaxID=102285 RepID=A0A0R3TMX2_RODNA|nr:unnamed protein product [Rodentolepis nana]
MAENQQAGSSQTPHQNKVRFFSTINIDELAAIIASKGRDNVRSSRWFEQNEVVRRAMGSNAWPISDQPIPSKNGRDEVLSIGEEYFLIINERFDNILRFPCRLDYISHFLSYYFSEKNLSKDKYMMDVITTNDGMYPLENLLQFSRLHAIKATQSELRESSKNIDSIIFALHNGAPVFKVLCLYVLNRLANNKATSPIRTRGSLSLLPVTYPNIPQLPDIPSPNGLTRLQLLQLFNPPTPAPITPMLTPNLPSQQHRSQETNSSQGMFTPGPVSQSLPPQHVNIVGLKEPGQPPVNHSFHKFSQHACEGDRPIVVKVARVFALFSTGITMAASIG